MQTFYGPHHQTKVDFQRNNLRICIHASEMFYRVDSRLDFRLQWILSNSLTSLLPKWWRLQRGVKMNYLCEQWGNYRSHHRYCSYCYRCNNDNSAMTGGAFIDIWLIASTQFSFFSSAALTITGWVPMTIKPCTILHLSSAAVIKSLRHWIFLDLK